MPSPWPPVCSSSWWNDILDTLLHPTSLPVRCHLVQHSASEAPTQNHWMCREGCSLNTDAILQWLVLLDTLEQALLCLGNLWGLGQLNLVLMFFVKLPLVKLLHNSDTRYHIPTMLLMCRTNQENIGLKAQFPNQTRSQFQKHRKGNDQVGVA